MANYRAPNLVSQAGLYKTGATPYIDVSLGNGTEGANGETLKTFSAEATASSWADGDIVGAYIVKANGDYKVWVCAWDATNDYLERILEEDTAGASWADNDPVTVSAVFTDNMLANLVSTPPNFQYEAVSASTYLVTIADAGKTLAFTNAGGCVITLDEATGGSSARPQVILLRETAGAVTVDVEGSDTLNGNGTGTPVSIPDPPTGVYSSLFVGRKSATAWLAS